MLFLERRTSFGDHAGWDGLSLAEIDEVAMTSRLLLGLGLGLW